MHPRTQPNPIRVLIAEDSPTVSNHLVEILSADPELAVAGQASNGDQAFELCKKLRPDVVSMDMMMPIMNGLEATERIMAYCPTPIVIVSSSLNRREVLTSLDALRAGAVEALEKPRPNDTAEAWAALFRNTLKLVSRIKTIRHPRGRLSPTRTADVRPTSPFRPQAPPDRPARLIVIGASTGGPAAVSRLLRRLPKDYPLPIALILHIAPAFAPSLAEWLTTQTPIPIHTVMDGEPIPEPGDSGIWLAPPDQHLYVMDGRLRCSYAPARHGCRPSVDVLFESVAAERANSSMGILLTGMGRDGATGLLRMRAAGAQTIAQDEASSIIFGMPKEAIELGAAQRVLSLSEIEDMLLSQTGGAAFSLSEGPPPFPEQPA